MKGTIFLKLGGSLITDKTQPRTPRLEVLARLVDEIAAARNQNPEIHLIIGHGSGSFGHVPAKKYGTRQGVITPEESHGFVEVWRDANALNRLVMDALQAAKLPAIAFPPSAGVFAKAGLVVSWDLAPLQSALSHGIIPVIQGDTVFDQVRGGTILSTEDLFDHLARQLRPARILLAGIEPGVWATFPPPSQSEGSTGIIPKITHTNIVQVAPILAGSTATDVTGGMASKVLQSISLTEAIQELEVLIFSGEEPGTLRQVLLGAQKGTIIRYN